MPFHPDSGEYVCQQEGTLRAKAEAIGPFVEAAFERFREALARTTNTLPILSEVQLRHRRIQPDMAGVARLAELHRRVLHIMQKDGGHMSLAEWNWPQDNPELANVVVPYNMQLRQADSERVRAIGEELALRPNQIALTPLEHRRLLWSVGGENSWMPYEHLAAPQFLVPTDAVSDSPSAHSAHGRARQFKVVPPVPVRCPVSVGIYHSDDEFPADSPPSHGTETYGVTLNDPQWADYAHKLIIVKNAEREAFMSRFDRTIRMIDGWSSQKVTDVPSFMHKLHEVLIHLFHMDDLHPRSLQSIKEGQMDVPAIPTVIGGRKRNVPVMYPAVNAYALRTDLLEAMPQMVQEEGESLLGR